MPVSAEIISYEISRVTYNLHKLGNWSTGSKTSWSHLTTDDRSGLGPLMCFQSNSSSIAAFFYKINLIFKKTNKVNPTLLWASMHLFRSLSGRSRHIWPRRERSQDRIGRWVNVHIFHKNHCNTPLWARSTQPSTLSGMVKRAVWLSNDTNGDR